MNPILRQQADLVLRAVRGTIAAIDHHERCTGMHPSGAVAQYTIRRAKNGDVYAYVFVWTAVPMIDHWRIIPQPIFQRWTDTEFLALRNHMSSESYEGIYRDSLLRYAPRGNHPIFRDLDEVRRAAAARKETA